MKECIHISCASDERYFPGLLGTLASIVINTTYKGPLCFHIIDGGILTASMNNLEEILKKLNPKVQIKKYKPDLSLFDHFPSFFFDTPLTYARLLLPDLLKNIDRLIYTDTDILHLKDIENLWSANLEDNSTGVCCEVATKTVGNEYFDLELLKLLNIDSSAPYFNAGIMLMDLKKWREDNLSSKTMKFLSENPDQCRFHDQSAMNIILYKSFKLLDQSFNIQSHRESFKIEERLNDLLDFKINYHFVTSAKPWLKYDKSPPNLFFYNLLNTIGYPLNDLIFIQTKNIYLKKMKWLKLLPLFYTVRSSIKNTIGRKLQSKKDIKIAEFWKEQINLLEFYKKEQSNINKSLTKWKQRISTKLST